MKPTGTLKHEHRVILTVPAAADREAQALREGGALDAGRLAHTVDFFRTFADRFHHAREDKVLFAMADPLLTPQDQEELTRAFEGVAAVEMVGIHEAEQLARRLAR